jgi:hypothetical protein
VMMCARRNISRRFHRPLSVFGRLQCAPPSACTSRKHVDGAWGVSARRKTTLATVLAGLGEPRR